MPSNVLPLRLKQTFLLMIWIFTESEVDGIETRLLFKIFSTLTNLQKSGGEGIAPLGSYGPGHHYHPSTMLFCILHSGIQ